MNKKEFEKEFEQRQQQAQLESLNANRNRAQAVSIGMSGSGSTEITMRGMDGTFLWNVYAPTQVTEFIHQLAASIGCHIQLQPREDFGSWREWRPTSEEERLHLNGFPPFPSKKIGYQEIGELKKDSISPGFSATEKQGQENVAIKKAVNKRKPKRSRSSST
tara:strand:- start:481 stop:966 length:486 start_codon:yes stop_codon:yes gene_type:complete